MWFSNADIPIIVNSVNRRFNSFTRTIPGDLNCTGVTQTAVITSYIGVVHTERDQCH